jgi:hypothetical protein
VTHQQRMNIIEELIEEFLECDPPLDLCRICRHYKEHTPNCLYARYQAAKD